MSIYNWAPNHFFVCATSHSVPVAALLSALVVLYFGLLLQTCHSAHPRSFFCCMAPYVLLCYLRLQLVFWLLSCCFLSRPLLSVSSVFTPPPHTHTTLSTFLCTHCTYWQVIEVKHTLPRKHLHTPWTFEHFVNAIVKIFKWQTSVYCITIS